MEDKYTVKLYPKALRDLDGIYRYIYEVLQVPEYASGQLERRKKEFLDWSSSLIGARRENPGFIPEKGIGNCWLTTIL